MPHREEDLRKVIETFAHSEDCPCCRPLSRRQFFGWAVAASGLLLPESLLAKEKKPGPKKSVLTLESLVRERKKSEKQGEGREERGVRREVKKSPEKIRGEKRAAGDKREHGERNEKGGEKSRPPERRLARGERRKHEERKANGERKGHGDKRESKSQEPIKLLSQSSDEKKSSRRERWKNTLMQRTARQLEREEHRSRRDEREKRLVRKHRRGDKHLFMTNPHTGEVLRVVFWSPDGGYIRDSLRQINSFFRDFRANKVRSVDRRLLNILYAIQSRVGGRPLQLLSGYRTKRTNRIVGSRAAQSYHLRAQAADIAVAGVSGRQLAAYARKLRSGGIGTGAAFVHVDCGGIREWHY